MREQIYMNGITFLTVKCAADRVSYSTDYVAKLARQQKVRALLVGSQWYVDVSSLEQYKSTQQLESIARNRQLKISRRLEHQVRTVLAGEVYRPKKQQSPVLLHVTILVLFLGVVGLVANSEIVRTDLVASVHQSGYAVSPLISSTSSVIVETSDLVLMPQFGSDTELALIASDRHIYIPDTKSGWLTIRYE